MNGPWTSVVVDAVLFAVFGFGFLNEGRMRQLVETTRGAVFTHTQNFDLRFDDITNAPPTVPGMVELRAIELPAGEDGQKKLGVGAAVPLR